MKRIDLCGDWAGKCIFPDKHDFEFGEAVPGQAIFDLINASRYSGCQNGIRNVYI